MSIVSDLVDRLFRFFRADVYYKLQFRSYGSPEETDLGVQARRIGEYETLVDERRLGIKIRWGWNEYEDEEALDLVHKLWRHFGFFLLRGSVKVRIADGTVFHRPEKVPAGAKVVTLEYEGRLPLPNHTSDGYGQWHN